MTWNDNEFSPRRHDSISIGDVDNWENDDFNIAVTGSSVYGVSFVIGDNAIIPEEYLEVWAADGSGEQFLHQFPHDEISSFIGIVSPVPIRRVHFNEDAGGDDIWIANLFFATR